jgi:hypothetical protein
MKRVTLVFSPKPRNGRELGQLIEAIAERIPVKGGKTVDEIEVSVDDMVRVNKLLRMHGYEVVDKRTHEAAKRPLVGALEKLNEKYIGEAKYATDEWFVIAGVGAGRAAHVGQVSHEVLGKYPTKEEAFNAVRKDARVKYNIGEDELDPYEIAPGVYEMGYDEIFYIIKHKDAPNVDEWGIHEGMFSGTDDRPKKVTPPPSVHKRKVMNYINSKARKARQQRMKTRAQHKRDRLDGRIEALDDVIRYLRKK